MELVEHKNILFRTKISFKIDYYILMYNDVSLDLQLLQFTSKITKKENDCKITEQVYRLCRSNFFSIVEKLVTGNYVGNPSIASKLNFKTGMTLGIE
jgi:hypothetical protein